LAWEIYKKIRNPDPKNWVWGFDFEISKKHKDVIFGASTTERSSRNCKRNLQVEKQREA